VHVAHFITCDIGVTTRWHEIRAQFRGRDEEMTTTTRPMTTTTTRTTRTTIAAYRSRESRVSPTEIWSRTLSNVRLHDNHLERVYNSPRIFMLPAAANCDSLTAVTKICHKELSFKDKWSRLITGVQGVFKTINVLLFGHCTLYNL